MVSSIILSCVFVQTLIAIYLFNTLQLKDDFEKLLNATLIILVFHLGTKLFILTILKDSFLYNNNVTGFSFFYGPLLFVAANILIDKPLSKKKQFLHFLPFLMGAIFYIFNTTGYIFHFMSFSLDHYYKPYYHWAAMFSLFGYSLIAQSIVRKSSPTRIFQNRLIHNMSIVLMVGVVVGISWGLIDKIENNRETFDPKLVPYFFLAAWPVFILRYKLFVATTLSAHTIQLTPPSTFVDQTEKEPERQYRKSALDKEKLNDYEISLKKFMDSSRIYLETEVSLEDLSEKAKIPKHHLTQLLSERFGKNFYVFINEYRIHEAIRRLKHPYVDESILSLAYDCGFNSKSSFNNYFKKMTGLTPSAYRKQHFFGKEQQEELRK